MKRLSIAIVGVLCLLSSVSAQAAITMSKDSVEQQNTETGKKSPTLEDYRRSSLCLILLTHRGTKYAEEMQQQFLQMPLPIRYNDHNVDVRVFNCSGNASKKDIEKLLRNNDIPRKLVARWFNRDTDSGYMNMDYIHERGGFNANFSSREKADYTERGVAALPEEGVALIQNTFVMVCDMDYRDKGKGFAIGSAILQTIAEGAQLYAQSESQKGNDEAALWGQAGSLVAAGGAAVTADLGGFAVKMKAHLFRLKWNDNLTQKIFGQYWVDKDTPQEEIPSRIAAFDNDKKSFELSYLGHYKAKSGKTVFKSQNDMNQVIRMVCAITIDRGITNLAKMFPEFKPRSTYTVKDDNNIAAYIGSKEEVSYGKKYEVVEPVLGKKMVKYKPKGMVKAIKVWDNKNIRLDEVSDINSITPSQFRIVQGAKAVKRNNGYEIREYTRPPIFQLAIEGGGFTNNYGTDIVASLKVNSKLSIGIGYGVQHYNVDNSSKDIQLLTPSENGYVSDVWGYKREFDFNLYFARATYLLNDNKISPFVSLDFGMRGIDTNGDNSIFDNDNNIYCGSNHGWLHDDGLEQPAENSFFLRPTVGIFFHVSRHLALELKASYFMSPGVTGKKYALDNNSYISTRTFGLDYLHFSFGYVFLIGKTR